MLSILKRWIGKNGLKSKYEEKKFYLTFQNINSRKKMINIMIAVNKNLNICSLIFRDNYLTKNYFTYYHLKGRSHFKLVLLLAKVSNNCDKYFLD